LRSLFELMQASNLRSTQVILLNKEGLVGAEASADLLGEKGTLKRNPERILRWNVATQQGQTSAQEAVAGRAGSLIEGDRIGRSERVWGFSPLKDFQFPEFLSWSVVVSAATEDVMSDLFSQRRIFYPLLLAFFLIFSLTGYGMARALTREYLEFSVKLKDETIRIAEVGDELVESCEKSSGRDVDQSALATQVLQQSISLSAQTGELSAAMADSVNALRSASAEIQSQKNASQRSLAELRQAAVKLQEMQRLMSIISEMKTRVSALNEIVFKVQLVGFNATIEANRAGQSGRGFAGVAQEIQLFSEQTEQLARELSEQLARIHLQSDEITSAVNMRVESAERIVSDSSRALTQTERSIPVVADALEESIRALRDQDEKFRTIAEFVDGLESVVRKSLSGNTDVVRRAQAIREQMYFLEDIVQEFGHSVKGLRVRSRLRKNSSNSVFGQSAAVSPERARADAVDRLAQKMRPRLVVKPEDHEPEVSDSFLSGENRRDAG
jgi:CRISPR/Cas system CSM-associated protein Csm2 small subunit